MKQLDISEKRELRTMVEEMLVAEQPQVLQIDHHDVAVLVPLRGTKVRHRVRCTSADDPLWNIVGLAQGDVPGMVAEDVDMYLADTYALDEE